MTLAEEQQAMLDAVSGRWSETALRGLTLQGDALRVRGLKAYRSNAQALAQRALAAAYPVVREMLGDENFGALARAFWQAMPPVKGDLAQWGSALSGFVASAPQLGQEPQLPDVARVEWALHDAATAADVVPNPESFVLLMQHDPTRLRLVLAAGLSVVDSAWPVASLVNAHLAGEPAMHEAAQRMHAGVGETAVIWRPAYRPMVREAADGELALLEALLAGGSVSAAMERALDVSVGFDISQWLVMAVHDGLVAGVSAIQPGETT